MTAMSNMAFCYFNDPPQCTPTWTQRLERSAPIRVAIIDDCALFRRGIGQALAGTPDIELIDQAEKVGDGIRIAYEKRPDVIVLSGRSVDRELEAIGIIRAACPNARVVVISATTDLERARAAFLAGVRGFLSRAITRGDLIDAIRRVAGQPVIVTQGLSPMPAITGQLSPREQQILDHISAGSSNKEIARYLRISEKTVKQHITSLLSKLDVRNRVEAAALAATGVSEASREF